MYLSFELFIFLLDRLKLGKKGIIGWLKSIIIPFKLLGLPPSPAVLKPHSHLPRLQSQLLSQLSLPLRLQFVLCLKAFLQQMNLNKIKQSKTKVLDNISPFCRFQFHQISSPKRLCFRPQKTGNKNEFSPRCFGKMVENFEGSNFILQILNKSESSIK